MLPDNEAWKDEWDTDLAGDDDLFPGEEEATFLDEEIVPGYNTRWNRDS